MSSMIVSIYCTSILEKFSALLKQKTESQSGSDNQGNGQAIRVYEELAPQQSDSASPVRESEIVRIPQQHWFRNLLGLKPRQSMLIRLRDIWSVRDEYHGSLAFSVHISDKSGRQYGVFEKFDYLKLLESRAGVRGALLIGVFCSLFILVYQHRDRQISFHHDFEQETLSAISNQHLINGVVTGRLQEGTFSTRDLADFLAKKTTSAEGSATGDVLRITVADISSAQTSHEPQSAATQREQTP